MAAPPPRRRPRPDGDGRPRRPTGTGRGSSDRTDGRADRTGRPARANDDRRNPGAPGRRAGGDRTARGRPERPGARSGERPRGEDDDARAVRRQQRDNKERRAPRQWGGVARRGARELAEPEPGSASAAWREAVDRTGRPEAWEPERWEREADAPPRRQRTQRATPPSEPEAPRAPDRRRRKAPEPVARELKSVAGARKAPRLEERLMDAARAYERERYADARRMVARLAEEAPGAAAVRELHGLTLYRLGRWREASKELEAYRALTGSVEQNPVLADCYRALRRYKKVDELWDELRTISPGADLVAEGRIVAAGARADQGRIDDAIALLERGRLTSKRPQEHHLRLWYALADLYERAGDVPRARELFKRVASHEADFADAAERLSSLG